MFWYRHKWHKALWSEWRGKREGIYHDSQLYGTKKCERCGIYADGYADSNHPSLRNVLGEKS